VLFRSNSAQPYALTVVLLASAIGIYILGKFVFGRKGHAMYAKASRAGQETRLTGMVGWLAAGAFALTTLLALAPHLGVVLTSLTPVGRWYGTVLPDSLTTQNFVAALSHDDAFGSIRNSLVLSVSAMGLDLVAGLVIAYLIVRTKIRGRGLLDALTMMPLAVPGRWRISTTPATVTGAPLFIPVAARAVETFSRS